jgi:hypothetical protein
MISPSSALPNWLRGTSTFLLMPMMSVNCSRRKSTPNRWDTSSRSSLLAPVKSVGKFSRLGRSTEPLGRCLPCAMMIGLRVGERLKETSGGARG